MEPQLKFQNKSALVTGSNRGIGAGIAKLLATQGARVAVTYSNPNSKAKAEETLHSLPKVNAGEHILLEMNMSDESSIETAIQKCIESFGGLDFLVNNAGITKDALLLRMKTEQFDQVIQTNLRGCFIATRAATKFMLKAKKPASIVNITSVVGQTGNAGQSNYSASKAGLEAFTKSIAQELASRQIRLNCVAPGFIVTDMTDALTDEQKDKIKATIPMNSLGEVSDIANAVSFLLSDESKYITGHTLSVNGGMYMN